jgi:hypothetical protein
MNAVAPSDLVAAIAGNPRFKRLADYLATKAPPGKLPGRQHIDPTELTKLLPWLMLIDVVPQESGAPRYRHRLVGTETVAMFGTDGTGKFLDEVLTGDEGAAVIRNYSEILRMREPHYRNGVAAIAGREHVPYERIVFPLAADGEHIDMLIVVFASLPG